MTELDLQTIETIETVGALVVVLDLDHRIVYWNRSCSDLTGYSLEDVRGRRPWEFLLVPEEVESVKALLADPWPVAQSRRLSANYWVTQAGERRWIAWSHTLARGPDGQAQYIVKTGIDRTEPKRLEEALQGSEARLAGLIDMAADAIISVDGDQRIAIYNRGAEKIFGWSAAEVMGRPLDMLLPERLRGAHARHVREFGSGGGDARSLRMGERGLEIIGLRKSGEEFPADAAISRIGDGGTSLFTVILRDVTAQQRRETEQKVLAEVGAALVATLDVDELLASLVRVVVRNLADCCVMDVVAGDGSLRRMKVAHRDPARAELCERLQRIALDLPRDHPMVAVLERKRPALIAEVSEGRLESLACGEEHLRALQELAPRSLMVLPLLARGQVFGLLTFVSSHPVHRYGPEDLRLAEEVAFRAALAIDNVRLYQDARRHADERLEANQQMVHATLRAQALANEAEQARTRAEASERKLSELAEFRERFIGILGHDLRNPIGAIQMSISLLARHGGLDPQDQKVVARIANSATRMKRMVHQLLDITRARLGGGFPLTPSLTDLREVCRVVVQEFQASIQLDVQGDVTGSWDSDRLEEALSNIVGNAIEYAAPGTAVALRARDSGDEVVVEISNQGDPIPPDLLPHLFELFRQVNQRRPSPTGHLGLGLYIASQIVQSHGGTLEARSAGGTTTFVMRLPCAHGAEGPGAVADPAREPLH